MPHRNSSSSTTALSLCLLTLLILCLNAFIGLNYDFIAMTSINSTATEGLVDMGEPITVLNGDERQRRKLFLINDPKTVEQKPAPVVMSDPKQLCKSVDCKTPGRCVLPYDCIYPDPPGAPRLNTHRGISLLLNWKDCSTVQQCLLAYLMVPKAGSTLVKSTMSATGEAEPVWLSPADGTALTNNNPLIFTLIRDPGERIVSAYSTIMSRKGAVFGRVNNEVPLRFLPSPADVNDIVAWTHQFKQSMHLMMLSIKNNGWYNSKTNPVWDEHIIPQVEFMRGLNVSFIGCVSKVNEVLVKFQLDNSSEKFIKTHTSMILTCQRRSLPRMTC
ncbi:hypothetical protein HJC23_000252 [Cyclotella cryptica]|uniref:Sulfotransferase n=1 Tax=Cyclotella cryptica TaxID=29204 RepID=A0ABD3QC89_9STRA|eukprot:CCRYP_006800-RA/>CCRYP_006800-RA protein AED:0.17 eAED:0.17 QI:0/-1/0/1/-1/1/1/0/329